MNESFRICSRCDGDGLSTGPPECRPCRRCNGKGRILEKKVCMKTTKKIIDSFIEKYPIDPSIGSIGDGGNKICVYLFKKIKNHGFPEEYEGIPVTVIYVGRIKLA